MYKYILTKLGDFGKGTCYNVGPPNAIIWSIAPSNYGYNYNYHQP